jgi:exodeoxyribonuclease VII large subunit
MPQEIYTISKLNQFARELLEGNFPLIWVEGEISNYKRPTSGHAYFSLKDANAQVRCAMFRNRNSILNFEPRDGTHVLAQVRVSLYEPRGDFQLIVQHLEETGDGALRRAFEILKTKLAQEGLFDEIHKKPLPAFPNCVGVITSSTGAAVQDILHVLKRRAPQLRIIIYPTAVQGNEAAPKIVNTLQLANQRKECDVLIIARGGGSLEDLWPFNEEIVARAIFKSEIPIVSGVGHEIDFTIADFVADQRAPTPSAAAELISPHREDWLQKIVAMQNRLRHFMSAELRHYATVLISLRKRLQHPGHRLQEQAQRLDLLERNLISAWQHQLTQTQQRLVNLSRALNTVSPLNTLERGYAIVTHQDKIIREANEVKIGEDIKTQLAHGSLLCTVTGIIE